MPAWHIPQASLLRTALNVPAPHMLHAPTVVAPYPALQEQKVLPWSLWESAQHDTHNPGPFAALYVPGGHAEHRPPLLSVYPALHEQKGLPCSQPALLGQLMQLLCPVVCVCV